MQWIAPSEKDVANDTLVPSGGAATRPDVASRQTGPKRLWAAADQLRANSGLTSQQYSQPVLGLIFLRFAEVRFEKRRAALDKSPATSRRGSRVDDPSAYHAESVLYLPAGARFAHLLHLPEGADVGARVNAAMRDIEKHNAQLAGVLPQTNNLFTSTLLKELLKRVSVPRPRQRPTSIRRRRTRRVGAADTIPASLDYDAFGRTTGLAA